jgi:ribonuclease HI
MNQYDQSTTKRNKDDSIEANMGKSGTGCWTKPPIGVIKINWDAAMDSHIGTMGLGKVARDYEGRVVAMSSSTHINHSTMVETLVAWQAMVLGVQLGATYLELEGDAMEMVQGLNQANHCWGRDGPVLNDIKMLFQNFNGWQVKYVPRKANGATQRLARLALY